MKKPFKRLTSLLLALVLTLTLPSGALAAGSAFSDVAAGDWFYEYVSALSKTGVISGYPDGRFGPGDSVKLGEMLKLCYLAAGSKEKAPTGSHWASGYMSAAVNAGLISSGSDADSVATRLQTARTAAKLLGFIPSMADSPFPDCDDGYVTVLYECGVINGRNDGAGSITFSPDETLTRSEVSAIVYRMTQKGIYDGKLKYNSYWVDVMASVPAASFSWAGYPHKGVDVSFYQGNIDWAAVKADGVDFAMIRLGYRGYSAGSINLDTQFLNNIKKSTAAGVKTGVYFFSQAITPEEAVEEAEFVLENIKGYDVSYPVCFDWESFFRSDARTDGLDRKTLTKCAVAFCDTIKAAGYTPMIYFTSWLGYTQYDLSALTDYEFWYAQYSSSPTFYYDFDMWQYTSSGKVDGIAGLVDINVCRRDYSA